MVPVWPLAVPAGPEVLARAVEEPRVGSGAPLRPPPPADSICGLAPLLGAERVARRPYSARGAARGAHP